MLSGAIFSAIRIRASFSELSCRIDNLDTKVNNLDTKINNVNTNLSERVDRILLRLDNHIKETAANFRSVDERFDRLPSELMECMTPYFNSLDKMLSNHENRITALEQKH